MSADTMAIDRADLLAVLELRFNAVPERIQAQIAGTQDAAVLERLILVAANAESWNVFVEELQAGAAAFRMIGEQFNPLGQA